MTDKQTEIVMTRDEVLVALLTETQTCRKALNRIAGWVALFGVLMLIGMALVSCGLAL